MLSWLADDAHDLWIDLAAESWNLFLLWVAVIDPRVVAAPPGPFRDTAVLLTLADHDVVPAEARAAVEALVKALAAANREPRDAGNQLGPIGAALALW